MIYQRRVPCRAQLELAVRRNTCRLQENALAGVEALAVALIPPQCVIRRRGGNGCGVRAAHCLVAYIVARGCVCCSERDT